MQRALTFTRERERTTVPNEVPLATLMGPKHGTKPRPRVAVIAWPQAERPPLEDIFATTYFVDQDEDLPNVTDLEEVDVIIYGPKAKVAKFAGSHHNIFFANVPLLGLGKHTYLATEIATGEEFQIVDGDHPFGALVRAMASAIGSARGKHVYIIQHAPALIARDDLKEEVAAWESSILLRTRRPDGALAAIIVRRVGDQFVGLALLPHATDRLTWLRALCEHWTPLDPATFGGIGD